MKSRPELVAESILSALTSTLRRSPSHLISRAVVAPNDVMDILVEMRKHPLREPWPHGCTVAFVEARDVADSPDVVAHHASGQSATHLVTLDETSESYNFIAGPYFQSVRLADITKLHSRTFTKQAAGAVRARSHAELIAYDPQGAPGTVDAEQCFSCKTWFVEFARWGGTTFCLECLDAKASNTITKEVEHD